jgi:sirohydrochlorin ferrochelatase
MQASGDACGAAKGQRSTGAPGSRLVLVAHGSRDPRAQRSTLALARAVRRRAGAPVEAAFLDFSTPRLVDALAGSASPTVVVPLLLTKAYHGRVDVPTEVERARVAAPGVELRLAEVLGPVAGPVPDRAALDAIVAGLVRRLGEAGAVAGERRRAPAPQASPAADGIVLAAAGSRDASTLDTVEWVAEALEAALGVPCRAGYASGTGPGTGAAVAGLAGRGGRRIAVAGYFLAPGLLFDRAVNQALAAGAACAAAPLGDAPELVDLVLARAAAAPGMTELEPLVAA